MTDLFKFPERVTQLVAICVLYFLCWWEGSAVKTVFSGKMCKLFILTNWSSHLLLSTFSFFAFVI